MGTAAIPDAKVPAIEEIVDTRQTSCCIVGGGPGGMMLGLLLARHGVDVTVLEAHKDFDREFRGDTLHPSILEILDQIGLAEPLHKLRHNKIYGPTLRFANTSFSPIDFRTLKTKFPYIMLIPQTKFLEFLAAEAKNYPSFRLQMLANVDGLIEEDGVVRGVQRGHPRDSSAAHGGRRRTILASSAPRRHRAHQNFSTHGRPVVQPAPRSWGAR
jgi:2-polyprenyl-6-methoxyphenol hydroxylase-like FAD-dependent oxidoreductase